MVWMGVAGLFHFCSPSHTSYLKKLTEEKQNSALVIPIRGNELRS